MSARTLAASGRIAWPKPWRGSGSLLALSLALLLGTGCASQQKVPATTAAPPSSARTEVAELEKSIADHKASLGGDADRAASPPAAAEAQASPMTAGTGSSSRCDGVCRAGQEICTASRRICKIAIELADAAITASCQRAERECNDASALCAQCK